MLEWLVVGDRWLVGPMFFYVSGVTGVFDSNSVA